MFINNLEFEECEYTLEKYPIEMPDKTTIEYFIVTIHIDKFSQKKLKEFYRICLENNLFSMELNSGIKFDGYINSEDRERLFVKNENNNIRIFKAI
jgi:hypothetical protein